MPKPNTRRAVLLAARRAGVAMIGFAGASHPALADEGDLDDALLRRLTGTVPIESPRVRLVMPPAFGNGYTVPLVLDVDSPMTDADHVRQVRVFAPKNPIVLVAGFGFTPASGQAHVSTRIRLAEPQTVFAVAEMSDGTTLMARTWVKVDTNGCA